MNNREQKQPVILSEAEKSALQEGIRVAEGGLKWSWQQVKEIARKRRESWKENPTDLSA